AAYGMPGAGSSYSFRSRLYRVKRLADITFTGSEFNTLGIWKHGILISLGDVALEDLTADSSILETLAGFTPPEDIVKASQFAGYLEKGIAGGEIVYKDSHPAIVDTTYVVRSIAYRGEHWESLKEVVYDELEFDKRRDVIVAFRVIRLVPNESATIVWKVLSDKKSPRIEGG
ncbi:MAG: hypothetical protein OEM82_15925, partial [Acidobacteriota bacterium]|nr:hypothetical protein [Acidobacteriota bacterium]